MKKSRKVFIGIVAAIIAATLGAFIGAVVGATATKWLAIAALVIIGVKGVCQFVADSLEKNLFSHIVDGAAILLIGGVIGSLQLIHQLIYGGIFVAAAVMCLVFIFGFTGHENHPV